MLAGFSEVITTEFTCFTSATLQMLTAEEGDFRLSLWGNAVPEEAARMITYAEYLAYADVCWRMQAFDSLYEEMKYQKKLQDKAVLNFFRTTVDWREKVVYVCWRMLTDADICWRTTVDWREKVFFGNAIVVDNLILKFYNSAYADVC